MLRKTTRLIHHKPGVSGTADLYRLLIAQEYICTIRVSCKMWKNFGWLHESLSKSANVFFCKPLICQARDNVSPDICICNQFGRKKREERIVCISVHLDVFLDTFFCGQTVTLTNCCLNYLMKTARLLYEYWQE